MVHLNNQYDMKVPSFHDPDGSLAFANIQETATYPVPWTILPDFTSVTFAPLDFTQVGIHTVYVRLYDDGGAFSDLPVQVTVVNCVPTFTLLPLPSQQVSFNTSTDILLTPFISDHEGHTIELTPWKFDAFSNLVAPPYFVT
jgi:hypothetical protein